jgi:hypothetical protein
MKKNYWACILGIIFLTACKPATLFPKLTASAIPAPVSEELILIGRFEKTIRPPYCGIDHTLGISEFTDLTTTEGQYSEETIDVIHDCYFILLTEPTKEEALNSLQVGKYYLLKITSVRLIVQKRELFRPKGWKIGSGIPLIEVLYFCHHADLFSE